MSLFKHLYIQVIVAVLCGAILGFVWPSFASGLKPLSDVFINLIRMVLLPVIFGTVVLGIARMENMRELGRVGAKALAYFEIASTLALIIGMVVVNIVRPGTGIHADPLTLDAESISQYTKAVAEHAGLVDFLVHIVPSNIVESFASGNILQVLFFSLLLGIALAKAGDAARPFVCTLESLLDGIFHIVSMVMRFAPLGALGAMAFTISKYGLGSLASMGLVLVCVYATCLLFAILSFGLIARLVGFSAFRFLRYIRDEIVTVFGTCSSESVLPRLMQKLEMAGVPRTVVGLVLPGGLTFNACGSAIYFTIGALFIAQATDTSLSMVDQLAILGVLMLTSKGSAGVAGAGFVTLAATLGALHKIPVSGLVLLLGVDRFMAEARSVTNTISNAFGAVAVAAWEGVLDREKLAAALRGELEPEVLTTTELVDHPVTPITIVQ
ncbi:C4-dicarboxylate transporter DctA [Beijerinckia indica]|uniref:Sodium:dicarboxylate symporter n=1 Tax=Beijerinckia indica subsp. indica (strain ATCC 9039 / DSM 1715 / NCIMB 8712) TaxID=395963 RepID=B2IES7_BEII9|nr:C4-dicarboxylate transporter DctA [Beijerinckia indica]ACB97017.1 sodium:dicarboxylate symporter [Beijerinckia indica subsp. indica ATCC 9039]